jgi:hypothetical protein
MNQKITSPDSPFSSRTEPKRRVPLCRHRTRNGKPCRYSAADPHSGLCPRHAASPTHRYADPQVASDLLGDLTEFQSACEVNQFLSRLLLLLAQDRLSPRRGSVMAYTCNLLLRSLHAIDMENKSAAPQEIIWDLPHPEREEDAPPPPSHPTAWPSTTERPQT